VFIERSSLQSIDVPEAKGSEHDFKVYKETIGKDISKDRGAFGYLSLPAFQHGSQSFHEMPGVG
jgi:hypothetical protein